MLGVTDFNRFHIWEGVAQLSTCDPFFRLFSNSQKFSSCQALCILLSPSAWSELLSGRVKLTSLLRPITLLCQGTFPHIQLMLSHWPSLVKVLDESQISFYLCLFS